MIKRVMFLLLTLGVLLPSVATLAATKDTQSDWSKETIQRGIDLGVVPERLQKDYSAPITREEFAEILVNAALKRHELDNPEREVWTKESILEKVTIDKPFKDTDLEHVKIAYILGSIDGVTEDIFAPDKYITRQQAAMMLANTIHASSIVHYYDKDKIGYSDVDSISDWAYPAVSVVKVNRLMTGSSGKFMPSKNITREQAIVTVIRLIDYTDYTAITIRGDILAFTPLSEVKYNVGKDYVYVTYVDDNVYTKEDESSEIKWITYNTTNTYEYSKLKATLIYSFNVNLLNRDYDYITKPTLEGKGAKVDYGYMTVETLTEDGYLFKFNLKPILGYVDNLGGYNYGYPEVPVDPKPID